MCDKFRAGSPFKKRKRESGKKSLVLTLAGVQRGVVGEEVWSLTHTTRSNGFFSTM